MLKIELQHRPFQCYDTMQITASVNVNIQLLPVTSQNFNIPLNVALTVFNCTI